jgi:hypothetical protein
VPRHQEHLTFRRFSLEGPINRLRSLPLQIHPALERVLAGTRLTNQLPLDLLIHYGGPTGLGKAELAQVCSWTHKTKHHGVDRLIDEVFAALGPQTAIGTGAVETVISCSTQH